MSEDQRKYTSADLKEMQSWPLERKIQVSQAKILEFGLKLDKQIYVSFSGGKDSTVLLDLVRRVYPNTPAVFVDTGLEYPELREFVTTVPNVIWLRPKMNFRKVIETYGYPIISKLIAKNLHAAKNNPNCYCARNIKGEMKGSIFNSSGKWAYLIDSPFKISDRCCDVMKKQPGREYQKQTGLYPIYGIMACEGSSRKAEWMAKGCNILEGKKLKSQPMSFWTEQDVLEYIKEILQPHLDNLWYEAGYEQGCIRKRARKELRKINYRRLAYASVYGEILQDDKCTGYSNDYYTDDNGELKCMCPDCMSEEN